MKSTCAILSSGPEIRARLVFANFGDRMVHLEEFAQRLSLTEEIDAAHLADQH